MKRVRGLMAGGALAMALLLTASPALARGGGHGGGGGGHGGFGGGHGFSGGHGYYGGGHGYYGGGYGYARGFYGYPWGYYGNPWWCITGTPRDTTTPTLGGTTAIATEGRRRLRKRAHA